MGMVFTLVTLAVLFFWVYELISVISMKDEQFDGRNDKLIFFLLVFFGSIFGAVGFAFWKWFHAPVQHRQSPHLVTEVKQIEDQLSATKANSSEQ